MDITQIYFANIANQRFEGNETNTCGHIAKVADTLYYSGILYACAEPHIR